MHTNGLTALFVAVWLGTALPAGGGTRVDLGGPVAIDRASDTDFYVLSSDATVRRLRKSGNRFEQLGKFSIQGFPIDFTYSVSEQIPSLFVCSTLTGKGVISRYSTDGLLMNRWWLWHTCGGVDFDYKDHALYTAITDTSELYRIDIRKDTPPESVGELPREGKIGPIAVDAARKLVYVSDLSKGVVYEYDLVKRSTRTIATRLGSPVALYFDSETQLLYVADATAKRILSVSLTRGAPHQASKSAKTTSAKVQGILQNGAFAAPSGIVRGPDGDLVISDYDADRVFVVSPSGEVRFRYPP